MICLRPEGVGAESHVLDGALGSILRALDQDPLALSEIKFNEKLPGLVIGAPRLDQLHSGGVEEHGVSKAGHAVAGAHCNTVGDALELLAH